MVFCKSPPSKMFRKISNQILTKAALSSSRCGRQPGGVLKGVSSKHQVNITRKQLKHSDRMSSTSFSALLLVVLRWDRLNCFSFGNIRIDHISYHLCNIRINVGFILSPSSSLAAIGISSGTCLSARGHYHLFLCEWMFTVHGWNLSTCRNDRLWLVCLFGPVVRIFKPVWDLSGCLCR